VADADQPLWENVDQESSQKLICGNRHDLLLESRQSMVRDGDAVRIAGEIVQNMFER
jgi:hypothetical protein